MASLPTLSGREVVRVFGRDGWQIVHQRDGCMTKVAELRLDGLFPRSPGGLLARPPDDALHPVRE